MTELEVTRYHPIDKFSIGSNHCLAMNEASHRPTVEGVA